MEENGSHRHKFSAGNSGNKTISGHTFGHWTEIDALPQTQELDVVKQLEQLRRRLYDAHYHAAVLFQ